MLRANTQCRMTNDDDGPVSLRYTWLTYFHSTTMCHDEIIVEFCSKAENISHHHQSHLFCKIFDLQKSVNQSRLTNVI